MTWMLRDHQSIDEDAVATISAAMLPLLEVLSNQPNSPLRKWAISCVAHACRHLEYLIVPLVSQAAFDKASAMGLLPLEKYAWADQPTRMKDPGRKIFHFEHLVPVSDLVTQLIDLKPPTSVAIACVLRKANVAWILKSEDERLNRAGLRSRRKAGGFSAYRQVSIKLRLPLMARGR